LIEEIEFWVLNGINTEEIRFFFYNLTYR
jgi:hypothetical protein